MKRSFIPIFLLLITQAWALELPTVFSHKMVLQQELPVSVWGRATPGATVTVAFASQSVAAKADAAGNWSLKLAPLEASFEPGELVVSSGTDKQVFSDVLVGEVWLASGQSNMGWSVSKSVDADILALGANDPNLRLYMVGYQPSTSLEFSSRHPWGNDSPQSAKRFSAVAYQFARDLRTTLEVPVGIIRTAVGGTPSIAWTRSETIAKHPALRAKVEEWEAWWGYDFPFGIVQLPKFQLPRDDSSNHPWAQLRESQRRVAASDPNTGLIVTLDLGEANDIHPPNKFPVARRLARWALTDIYGKLNLRGGPEIETAVRDGNSIHLSFTQTGEGLHLHDGNQLGGFTASDTASGPANGRDFYPVEAKIHSKTEVLLQIPKGKNPVKLRYAWQANPSEARLTNIERLPAGPFEIELQ